MPVNTPHKDYAARLGQWSRSRDCYEGSDAVKAAGVKYLPMLGSHEKEPERYKEYVLRALFYNATGRTVDGLSGLVFQKEVVVETPTTVKDDVEDVTLTGVSLEMLGLLAMREVLKVGRHAILVDMAPEQTPGAEQRPYWIQYRTEDVIAWRTERIAGDATLVQVVLRETAEETDPKDPFCTLSCEQYRVLDLKPGASGGRVYTQTVYSKVENSNDYAIYGEPVTPQRRGVPLDFIPLVFIGPTSISPVPEKPPLIDLVDVNLSHYRTMADLEHGRHWTALPTPWVAGIAGEQGGDLYIGSGKAWILDKDGQAGMLEFSGQGLASLVTADQDKRKMMATLGARLLEDQPDAAETATAVSMRHSGEHATLKTVTQTSEAALTIALQWHAWWKGTEAKPVDTKAKVELNKEFFSARMTPDELRALMLAYQGEGMSFATFYAALQRGQVARPGVTAEEEQAEIDRQGGGPPEPGAVPPPPPQPGTPPGQPPAPPMPPVGEAP